MELFCRFQVAHCIGQQGQGLETNTKLLAHEVSVCEDILVLHVFKINVSNSGLLEEFTVLTKTSQCFQRKHTVLPLPVRPPHNIAPQLRTARRNRDSCDLFVLAEVAPLKLSPDPQCSQAEHEVGLLLFHFSPPHRQKPCHMHLRYPNVNFTHRRGLKLRNSSSVTNMTAASLHQSAAAGNMNRPNI